MGSETDVIESLNAVGYQGKFLQIDVFSEAITGGPKVESFRELVTWIVNEIHILRNTEEKVALETDFNEFMLELSAFLKELGCPYTDFVAGPITGRIQTNESRLLLLDFLITELMASKMYQNLIPEEDSYVIPVSETPTASALQCITRELSLGKPPENISSRVLFEKIANKLDEVIKQTNPKKLSKPLFETPQNLSDAQWEKLEKLQKELDEEYNLRRQMLLTRLEVTIQSFQWSEKMKSRGDEIMTKYRSKSKDLEQYNKGSSDTNVAALLAARADMAITEKIDSATVRKNTASKIQKHVIGKVPDRGGRAYEHAPPPPEMPSWQQNRSTGPGAGGRGGGNVNRGGGGRGGGGGSQGSWNQQQNQGNQSSFGGQRQYDQRQQPQYGQGQQQQQYQSYTQRHDNNWSGGGSGGGGSGGSRVQGGWSQRGSEKFNQRGDRGDTGYYSSGGGGGGGSNYYASNQGNNYGQNFQNQGYGTGEGGNSGSYGNNRGTSQRGGRPNYNRGGGGGGGRR